MGNKNNIYDRLHLKKCLEMNAYVFATATILVVLFFLITNWGKAIYFTEANPYIRIIEIILGLFALPVLIKSIIDLC